MVAAIKMNCGYQSTPISADVGPLARYPGSSLRRFKWLLRQSAGLVVGGVLFVSLQSSAKVGPSLRSQDSESAISQTVPGKRFITVRDMVGEGVIGDPWSIESDDSRRHLDAISPDGSLIAVVVRRGNVEKGTNDGDLFILEAAKLFQGTAPIPIASFSSDSIYQPIAFVHWLPDNVTLLFAAATEGHHTNVYRLNVVSRELVQLTDLQSPLVSLEPSESGHQIALTTFAEATPFAADKGCLREGCLITAPKLWSAEHGIPSLAQYLLLHILNLDTGIVKDLEGPTAAQDGAAECYPKLQGGLSPDGRYGIRLCMVSRAPEWWEEYTVDPQLPNDVRDRNENNLRRLFLIDTITGHYKLLTDAPTLYRKNSAVEPLWIDGGRHVIVAGAVQSLREQIGAERARRAGSIAVLMFEPSTGKERRIIEIAPEVEKITAARWNGSRQVLSLKAIQRDSRASMTMNYRREGASWRAVKNAAEVSETSEQLLYLKQSINARPILIAKDGPKETEILDPNPWLDRVTLGRVEEVSWFTGEGRTWKGELYYPPDYRPGRRYPFLIQTHGFYEDTFSLAGVSRNFAAQPIAARGIVVLQLDEVTPLAGSFWQPEMFSRLCQRVYESAIDHFAKTGLIDRNKVGITGWSATGTSVGYFLTHSSYPVAAAAFTEIADIGWFYYTTAGTPTYVDQAYGGAPFGDGLKKWMAIAPTFNIDKVQTPMFLWGNELLGVWDWYAILRRLNKPVEFWATSDGTHDVYKVPQRILLGNLLVDWFDFWLNDREDGAANKTAQYQRWSELRALQSTH
jgi:hypothetical protein